MKLKRRAIKLLREILKASESQKAEIIERVSQDASMREALQYLESKNLVAVRRAWGGAVYDLSPLPEGITYFQDRTDLRRAKCIAWWGGFASGVAASVVSFFIIQAIQAAIG